MTKIVRDLDGETLSTVAAQHVKSFHLVEISFVGERAFLSEGPEMSFAPGGDVVGAQTFLEGRVIVNTPAWTGEAAQTCGLEILNEDGYAATLFVQNKIALATVRIWLVHQKPDNSFTTPVPYFTGSCGESELTPEALNVPLQPTAIARKFFPNQYIGASGFNHIPPEGAVVFWNNTSYVLERDYG